MNEAEWLDCTDPQMVLEFLRGKVSDRKLRLLACASCRLLWEWITDDRSRQAVEAAERLSEGLASEEERSAAFAASSEAATVEEYLDPEEDTIYLRSMAAAYAHHSVWKEAFVAAHATAPGVLPGLTGLPALLPVRLLKDIVGNPFRPITLTSAHRTPTVVSLALAAYDDRELPSGELDPQRLAVLSDALEEAGATGEILDHLRSPGPHVRGCWAVDLCLGLE